MANKNKGERKVRVKVIPRSSRNILEEIGVNEYVVRITALPEAGRANRAVVHMLAKHLGIAPTLFELISGAKSRMKVFLVK